MVDLVLLEGAPPEVSFIESIVRKVRRSAILDNLEKFVKCQYINRKILATNDKELASLAGNLNCTVHFFSTGESFHFGEQLAGMVNKFGLSKVFYLGGGAGLFLEQSEIDEISARLSRKSEIFFTNNYFSSDFVAFSPAEVVNSIDMPRLDNLLAYLLHEEGGLSYVPLKLSRGMVFDIDTPADILVLGMCGSHLEHTGKMIKSLALPIASLERMLAVFADKQAELLIFGRVNSTIFSHLEGHLKCRLRVFSEERGMKARGRIQRGEVISILASFLEEVGIEKFVQKISEICSGAFIDSRVIFAHLRKQVAKEDRYLSDFGDYKSISDEFVRDFTRACQMAPIPIVLGGHSLISGGLWVLAEMVKKNNRHVLR